MQESSEASRPRRRRAIWLVPLSAILGLLGAELGVRMFGERLGLKPAVRERLTAYARGENPGLFEGAPHVIYRLNPAHGVNAEGFADRDWSLEKEPRTLRIACLGASTTQDGFAPNRPSFPRQLEQWLEERLDCPVETMNFGVNGWTTAETLTNYVLTVADYRPDVVVVQHAVNDIWPRFWPEYTDDYRHYRAPYREVEFGRAEAWLFERSALFALWKVRTARYQDLEDRNTRWVEDRTKVLDAAVFTPETTLGFRQNMTMLLSAAQARGAVVCAMTIPVDDERPWGRKKLFPRIISGTRDHNEVLRELARDPELEGMLLADVEAAWTPELDEAGVHPLFTDFCHVTVEGNAAKAELVGQVLMAGGALSCPPGSGE